MTSTLPSKYKDPDSARFAFFDLGLQYYIGGRGLVFAQKTPVCATLLHHAVEMFLKGALCRTMGPAELKRLGHRLSRIWQAFEQTPVGATGLSQFSSVIKTLDQFEDIRYPDKMLAEGMQNLIELGPVNPAAPVGGAVGPNQPRLYRLVLAEIDALVKVLFDRGSVNPRAFTIRLNKEARACLDRDPKAPILADPYKAG